MGRQVDREEVVQRDSEAARGEQGSVDATLVSRLKG